MIAIENIKIGERLVGAGKPTFIVAEIGINHNGDMNLAARMISIAAEVGADAIKFQAYQAGQLVSVSHPAYDVLKKCELKADDIRALASESKDHNITFMATPFDEESVDLLASLAVPAFKIASGDITHIPLLQYIAKFGKPMIIATGASTIDDIEAALGSIRKIKEDLPVALLHCVSHYPTQPEQANLSMIKKMHEQFQLPIGFSDHTIGTVVPLTAVACGASIIEKHFTLDKEMDGPDHKSSCDPNDLRKLIQGIRIVEKSLGDTIKKPVESEKTRIAIRRSVTATRDIPKGTKVTSKMLSIKRPAGGIAPEDMALIIGRVALKDIYSDESIKWSMFQ